MNLSRPSTPMGSPVKKQEQSGNIKVIVRLRPFSKRESSLNLPNIVEIADNSIIIGNSNRESKRFIFDKVVSSFDPMSSDYVDQNHFYQLTGNEFLAHSLSGYNTCILTYGQTGSGKTFTMVGDDSNPGIVPLLIRDLFEFKKKCSSAMKLSMNYYEIYNEQVNDLLDYKQNLKVREHPVTGPYVDDLAEFPVETIQEVIGLIKRATANRSTAQTKMNEQSSRSHSILNMMIEQTINGAVSQVIKSSIKLVDLAGSERSKVTETVGERLKEGNNINKSLTTLGRVISTLATNNQLNVSRSPKKQMMVPYRDSILTWLLKESLSGNSKTSVIACVSPTDYEETVSTLRYCNEVKKISTDAKINARITNEVLALKNEISSLQQRLTSKGGQEEEESLANMKKLVSWLDDQYGMLMGVNGELRERNKRLQYDYEELDDEWNKLMRVVQQGVGMGVNKRMDELERRSFQLGEGIARDLERFDPVVVEW